jgi:Cu(I)/Ag(I) efflux system membrane fusion protein
MKKDFKHIMGDIINSYLVIKNDLSADNTTHVDEESKIIVRKAEEIEHLMKTTVHSGDFHKFHKKVDIHQLKEHAEKLPGLSIKDARKHFKSISEIVVKYVELFGKPMNVKDNELYTFHCPMYEGGSDWVQAEKKTANPFYGTKMLSCGTLKSVSSKQSGSKRKHGESHGKHDDHDHGH